MQVDDIEFICRDCGLIIDKCICVPTKQKPEKPYFSGRGVCRKNGPLNVCDCFMLTDEGPPRDLQQEIYNATLPILEKYRSAENDDMNRDRILGLAVEAIMETWHSARPE